MRLRFILLLFLVSFGQVYAGVKFNKINSETIYFYSSTPTTLTGVIKTITYPGPPNYESIKLGDSPEPEAILFLDHSISVLPKPGSNGDFEDPYRRVKQLELVIHSDSGVQVIRGRHVRVSGTFFSRHTGHHHTDVMMEVDRIEVGK